MTGAALLLHECALEPKRWREFLELLGRRLRASSATAILRSPALGESGVIYTWGGREDVSAEYARHYFALDPFVQLPERRVMTLHDFVPREQLERSAFFTGYLAPLDSIYHLGVDIRVQDRFYARLRVSRPRRAGNFSAADRRYVERLVPHLDVAIRTHAALDAVRTERAVYADAMDQLTLATVILDRGGRVVHSNALAREILARGDGIALVGQTLTVTQHRDGERLRAAISRAAAAQRAGEPGIVEVLRIPRRSGKGFYGMIVRPAAPRPGSGELQLSSAVAVFISAEDGRRGPTVEAVRRLFDLTPKEAQLALALVNGRTLDEAAASLGMARNTARAHLRSIFAKTGTDRQARLVRAVLSSVATLGS